MHTIRILDLDSAQGLGTELAAVLRSAGGELDVQRVTGEGAQMESVEVLFLVLPAGLVQDPGPLLGRLRRQAPRNAPEVPLVAVVREATSDQVLALLQSGVHDFLVPPLRPFEVLPRLWRLLAQAHPRTASVAKLKETLGLRHLVGESRSFLEVIEKVPLVARCEASVLISGETGTGKELVVRAIHYLGPRAKKPFIPVNCGAIPMDLVENELFGHNRSAFTGAVAVQAGLIEEAEGGTLLLDEVDSLPLLAQVKLLRFLQEREYRPLGSARLRKADVRVIAAANGDLEQAVAQGRLRQDLYYRLNVIPLRLPALRERREDIPLLAGHFLQKHSAQAGRPAPRLAPGSLQALLGYDWPGNVRELEHVIERAVVLSQEEEWIFPGHIGLPQAESSEGPEGFRKAKARAVAQFEASYVRGLLVTCQGNITRAARAAGKNRRAFWELIRKHGIDAEPFRPGSPLDDLPPRQDKKVLLRNL